MHLHRTTETFTKNFVMPEISILLPVYNGEETIADTVKSLLQQTYSDFELLVCIDGTNDRSEEIVRSFDDSRIKILKNEKNAGLGRTLNRLVYNADAETKYIAMAEQDDFYYPDRLQQQYEYMEENADCGLVSGIAEHYDGEKVLFSFPGILTSGKNYPDDLRENFLLNYRYMIKVTNSCMMFRKKVHVDNGLYFSMHYPSISVDWSYILRFSLVGKIKGLNIPLVRLDRRSNRKSLTTQNTKKYLASRELIRSFYYEHKDLITQKDYKAALTSEYLLELSSMRFYKRAIYFWIYFLKNPSDKRWYQYLKKQF